VAVVDNTTQILRYTMPMQLQQTMDKRLDVLPEVLPVRVETVVVTAVLQVVVDSIPTEVAAFMVQADSPSQMEVMEETMALTLYVLEDLVAEAERTGTPVAVAVAVGTPVVLVGTIVATMEAAVELGHITQEPIK
jgi:hypothetical protein